MKQALLITAYKNLDHLKRIIDHFDTNYSFYIHIDKKSRVTENEINALRMNDRVFVSRAYQTNWAGTNHLKCILLLMKMALRDKGIEYIHLISGHDFPIKSQAIFNTFLRNNKGKQFIEFFKLPSKYWENGGLDRLNYYYLYDYIDAKGKFGYLIHKIVNFQKRLGIQRKNRLGGMQAYGGSTWWTLSRDCCDFIADYIAKNPKILRGFNYTFCAEEIFFQTVILNSPFMDSVVNDNLRFIVWERRNGNMPAVLDESDYDTIKESKSLFARRFDYPVSKPLLEMLKTNKSG
ncbi:MAG: beta-1,6-N-acetylglucosaminyltransferase [Bacteroidota bacterium]